MLQFLNWLRRKVFIKQEPAPPSTGRKGEVAAEEFLRRERKFSILARNWRSGREEIDLICKDRDALVFVEVRARGGKALVPGYHSVNKRKKDALLRACRAYMKMLRVKPNTWRFDIVEVSVQPDGDLEVRHFENVPLFPKRIY